MKKDPETYEELIRYKRCLDFAKKYLLTEEELEQIYDFLKNNPDGEVVGGIHNISLVLNDEVKSVIVSNCVDPKIDGVEMNNDYFSIIPHYTPSSNSGGYSGGSSSNNNNNNK